MKYKIGNKSKLKDCFGFKGAKHVNYRFVFCEPRNDDIHSWVTTYYTYNIYNDELYFDLFY
jgi:hypothetical protein